MPCEYIKHSDQDCTTRIVVQQFLPEDYIKLDRDICNTERYKECATYWDTKEMKRYLEKQEK